MQVMITRRVIGSDLVLGVQNLTRSGQTHKKASQFAIGLLASLQFAQRFTRVARAITNLIFPEFK
jgi:hypothetical protein